MKTVLLFLICCSSCNLSCQTGTHLPYSKENLNSVFAVRGKVLPFIFGHTRIFTSTAGLEYRFLKRHSVGIDGIYSRFKTPTYIWDEATGTEVSGPFKVYGLTSLHFDYRYYFPFDTWQNRLFPYVNAFTKWGIRKTRFEEGLADHIQDERFLKYGLSTGCLVGFGKMKRWGIDLNLGLMHVSESICRTEYSTSGPQTATYQQDRWSGNMRMNCYYYLFRKN